jgi:hypothetical protein
MYVYYQKKMQVYTFQYKNLIIEFEKTTSDQKELAYWCFIEAFDYELKLLKQTTVSCRLKPTNYFTITTSCYLAKQK